MANIGYHHPQFYFKSKFVRASEMDFKEAFAFDEEDRLRAAMTDRNEQDGPKSKLMKRLKYFTLG